VRECILHVTSRIAWSTAQEIGQYAPESLAKQGFIHCSTLEQILRVGNIVFGGQHGLVLLEIDPTRLSSELRWEPGADLTTELFPHIHGPLNLEAVVDVLSFEPGNDGQFHLPKSLENADC
jgi:uncharacterized protein (DUF952 family)